MIIDTVRKVFNVEEDQIYSGTLSVSCSCKTNCAEVWLALKEFGGEGWVCHTGSSDILVFGPESPIGEENGFILSAEAVNGDESLHVSRNGGEWCITKTTKEPSEEDIIVKQSFIGVNDRRLYYEVAWQLKAFEDSDIKEYRPCAYRFIGFSDAERRD